MELYERGETTNSDVLSVAELDPPLRPILTMTISGGGIELNAAGKRLVREIHFNGYTVNEPDGRLYVMQPKDLTVASGYAELYRNCRTDGLVFLMGFGRNLGVPERNVHELMLGPDLESSILVEYLGTQLKPPQGFDGWDASLAGKPIYRLWSLNPATAEKSSTIAFVVEVVRKRIEMKTIQPKHFVLIKVYPVDLNAHLPSYFFTLPSGTYFENERKYEYRGEVIDERGRPAPVGVFRKFEGGQTYFDINGPESPR